jgi:hypothetical protein
MKYTTIKIKVTTKEALEELKIIPRESYEGVVLRLLKERLR